MSWPCGAQDFMPAPAPGPNGLWTLSTFWASDRVGHRPDRLYRLCSRQLPVFARAGTRFESHLGHSGLAGQGGLGLGQRLERGRSRFRRSFTSGRDRGRETGGRCVFRHGDGGGERSFAVSFHLRDQRGVKMDGDRLVRVVIPATDSDGPADRAWAGAISICAVCSTCWLNLNWRVAGTPRPRTCPPLCLRYSPQSSDSRRRFGG